ncbi:MFS transporter [Cupriavidus metallidurans]|uniref:MFS transporter n=1 Tax=Cupriavidus metallidurans TaxID=119219 RepID=UPI001CCC2A24|nr:MFS transporter [Cupriavidus metallidurans]UBM09350.1 MFS transporter [Cupriavidus metallidurans]
MSATHDPAAPKAGFYRYITLALITIVLALSTGDRATLSVAGPHMAKDLGLDAIQMGWLFSSFAWAYVLSQVPAGWLVDRIGAKAAITAGLVLWSLTTLLMGAVHWFSFAFAALLVLRFLLGAMESPVGPASGRVIAAWFPASERGVAGAIFNSAQYLSLVIFTPLMGWLDHQFGWNHIFTVMGGLGILLSLVWLRSYFAPAEHPSVSGAEITYIKAGGALVDLGGKRKNDAPPPRLADIGMLFRSRMLVGIFIAQYCITSITWFFVSWFPSYLVNGRGFSILQAGFVAAVPAICGFIGGVSTGFVSDALLRRTGSLTLARKLPITIGLLLSASMIACNYVDTDWLVIALMSLAFFGKGFGSLGWTVVADTAPARIVGSTGGVFNAVGNVAGIVTPIVIGYIIAETHSFNGALVYVGAHGLVAILCYWLVVGRIERMELPGAPAQASTRTTTSDPGYRASTADAKSPT